MCCFTRCISSLMTFLTWGVAFTASSRRPILVNSLSSSIPRERRAIMKFRSRSVTMRKSRSEVAMVDMLCGVYALDSRFYGRLGTVWISVGGR